MSQLWRHYAVIGSFKINDGEHYYIPIKATRTSKTSNYGVFAIKDGVKYLVSVLIRSRKNDYTKLRKTVYEKLCLAQQQLPQGWKFRIHEGLRSLDVQKSLFDEHFNNLKLRSSNMSEEELFKEASLLIVPLNDYTTPILKNISSFKYTVCFSRTL